jgi:hypothetical protein
LCVVALPLLRIFVRVLASENFLSKSSLFTPVAPRLKTKALLLMSVKPLFQGWLTTCYQAQFSTVLTSVPAMDNIVVSTE